MDNDEELKPLDPNTPPEGEKKENTDRFRRMVNQPDEGDGLSVDEFDLPEPPGSPLQSRVWTRSDWIVVLAVRR
jgi:hypothetical protein